jgi:septin 3/9/12
MCARGRSWDPIIKYIKDQHSAYLRKELTAMRDRYIQDTRIHCCLYFINPTGHSLRPIDVIVMKKLSEVVNVVPVIAKSDSLSLDERVAFKFKVSLHDFAFTVLISLQMQIREELVYHNIRLYPFDTDENDEEELQLNESIRVRILMRSRSFKCCSYSNPSRTSFLSLSLVPKAT